MTDEGIRLAAQLRRTHPEVGVIVMSAHSEPAYALALLESGSEGRAYLLKDRLHSQAQLLATIETVARGGSVIDPKVVDALVQGRSRKQRRGWTSSPRANARSSSRWRGAPATPPSRTR